MQRLPCASSVPGPGPAERVYLPGDSEFGSGPELGVLPECEQGLTGKDLWTPTSCTLPGSSSILPLPGISTPGPRELQVLALWKAGVTLPIAEGPSPQTALVPARLSFQ